MKHIDLTPDQNRALENEIGDHFGFDVEVDSVQDLGDGAYKAFVSYDDPKTGKAKHQGVKFSGNFKKISVEDFKIMEDATGKSQLKTLQELIILHEGKNEDHAEWQAGYGYALSLRKKNKTPPEEDKANWSKPFAFGFRAGWGKISEAVHRVKSNDFAKRGAPEDKARAFDKVNARTGKRPDRSVLSSTPNTGKYHAVEFSDEGDFIMVLVMGDGKEYSDGNKVGFGKDHEKDPWSIYYGVNVLFFPNGTIDADFHDLTSKKQWSKDKDKIIKAAKDALKDKDLPGIYDGLGGKSNKRGADKLSFDVDSVNEAENKSLDGVKLGGISTEKPTFSFKDRLNAKKVESELKAAGIEFKRRSLAGIFYFDFADDATMKKAVKFAKKVIDKEHEEQW